jgi:hypothetical protein
VLGGVIFGKNSKVVARSFWRKEVEDEWSARKRQTRKKKTGYG